MLIVLTSSLHIYHVSKYHTVIVNIVSVNYHYYHLLLLTQLQQFVWIQA